MAFYDNLVCLCLVFRIKRYIHERKYASHHNNEVESSRKVFHLYKQVLSTLCSSMCVYLWNLSYFIICIEIILAVECIIISLGFCCKLYPYYSSFHLCFRPHSPECILIIIKFASLQQNL